MGKISSLSITYINHEAVIHNEGGVVKWKIFAMPSTMLDSARESERGFRSSRC